MHTVKVFNSRNIIPELISNTTIRIHSEKPGLGYCLSESMELAGIKRFKVMHGPFSVNGSHNVVLFEFVVTIVCELV